MTKDEQSDKLLWMDLEMTGLDPSTQRIIEVAVIVTDYELTEIDTYEAIIHQDESILKTAEDWPRENMKTLFQEVRESKTTEPQVVGQLLEFIHKHFNEQLAVLAGNSIHQDRRFIRQWWPNIEGHLHYRMLDVSAYKLWLEGTKKISFQKTETHRALADTRESIAELKWALSQLSS